MEQLIEFDRDALEAALKNGLDLNDCDKKDLDKLLLNAEEEAIEEAIEESVTLDLNALGASYGIGDLDINMVIGNLVLLNTINSPLMTGLEEGDVLSFDQCCEALYVLYKGKEVLRPIMNIQERIKDVLILKSALKTNPELMDKMLDRVEKISESRAIFTEAAREFYMDNFKEDDLQDIVEKMVMIISDSMSILDNHTDTENEVKKSIDINLIGYEMAVQIAYLISSETGEFIDDVIWQMPLSQVFEITNSIRMIKGGEKIFNVATRKKLNKTMEIFNESKR